MRVKKRAEREARKLLEQFEIYEPPVDVEYVANGLGIGILQQYLEDKVSGLLVIDSNKVTIGVNKAHTRTRRRFTIAHELGHYILHRHFDTNVFVDSSYTFRRDQLSSEGTYLEEIAANAFAAELLMPEEMLRECYEYRIDWYDPDDVKQVASEFGVSEIAMTIRATNLGFVDPDEY